MKEEIKEIIFKLQDKSLACIVSMIYLSGFSGIRYFELRKLVFKELQRIDSKHHKSFIEC